MMDYASIYVYPQGDSHGELDIFENLGPNAPPMGKYVVFNIPLAGH